MSIGSITTNNYASVVEQLMVFERRPIVVRKNQQANFEKELTAIRGIQSKIDALKKAIDEALKPDALAIRKSTSGNKDVVTLTPKNGAEVGSYEIEVVRCASQQTVYGDQLNTETQYGWTGTFVINGKEIKVDSEEETRLIHYARAINNADAGVTATVVGGRLKIVSDKTGKDAAITWEDPDGILRNLGILTEGDDGILVVKNEAQAAQDAVIKLDGITFTRPTNTISDLIQDVTIHLHAVNEEGTSVTVTVETDNAAVRNEIQKVINAYNSLVADIEAKTAKEAILQGDTSLATLLRTLRQAISNVVPTARGEYDRASLVGIGTGSYESGGYLSGSLVVDTAKLDEAIAHDPASVISLFTSEQGIFARLDESLKQATGKDSIIGSRIDSLQKRIDEIERWAEDYERILEQREINLLRQFTRLEQAIADMETQQMWIQQQMRMLGFF